MSRPRRRGEDGSAVLLALVGLAMAGLVLVLAVDVTAYLAAAGRAQTAADAAALAAASAAHPRGHLVGEPDGWAETAAERNGATVVACGCTRGRREVEVTVSTPVGALLATRFLARSVRATARATLLPPDRDSQQDPEPPTGRRPAPGARSARVGSETRGVSHRPGLDDRTGVPRARG